MASSPKRTTDPGWHLVSLGSLAAAIGWFAIGIALAAARVLAVGARPDAWSTALVAGPLAAGWILQALVGSWTHLLPAIGPGGPAGHAARRAVLGRYAPARLAGRNAGVALLALGLASGAGGATVVGGWLAGATIAVDLGLGILALMARPPAADRAAGGAGPRAARTARTIP